MLHMFQQSTGGAETYYVVGRADKHLQAEIGYLISGCPFTFVVSEYTFSLRFSFNLFSRPLDKVGICT